MADVFISESENQTKELGESFAAGLKAGDIVLLEGDLGAGKTMFTKGIAQGLGVREFVTSPTYTIMNEYSGRLPLYHFDLYRLTDPEEFCELGLDDYLDGTGVCVIEWNILQDLQGRIFRVSIQGSGADKRRIAICLEN